MSRLRFFAAAREAAGTRDDALAGATVGEVLDAAVEKYGPRFAGVLESAAVWCNGEPVERDHPVGPTDEVAVLPPVSGGSDAIVRPGRLHARPSRPERSRSEGRVRKR